VGEGVDFSTLAAWRKFDSRQISSECGQTSPVKNSRFYGKDRKTVGKH
jgi:hypothetical protein